MKLVFLLILGLSLTAPALVLATCPVPGDLAQGITVVFDDGGRETFREVRPGIVAVYGQDPDGSGYVMTLAQGFHLLETRDLDDLEGALTYDYGMAETALPVPRPGESRTLAARVTDANGTYDENQVQSYGKALPTDIGTCHYRAFEGLINYASGDNYVESILYLPELGFGFLQWSQSDVDGRNPMTAISIHTGR